MALSGLEKVAAVPNPSMFDGPPKPASAVSAYDIAGGSADMLPAAHAAAHVHMKILEKGGTPGQK